MADRFIGRSLGVFCCCLAIISTTTASAQDSNSSTADNIKTVETVVVTATRRAEKIDKVPQSISAFTTAKMDNLGIKSIADLVHFTPGVSYDRNSKNVSIRGINSNAGAGTTGVYIDDTPIQLRSLGLNANNTLPAIFDLDRVEVLRGPQGTLFGAGSEGGTVRYITPQPNLTEYQVYARSEVSVGDNGTPNDEIGAAVGGPIVDGKLAFRVSAWARHDAGTVDKVDYLSGAITKKNANTVDTYVLRGALTWIPAPELTITPSIYYQNRHKHDLDDYWLSLSNPAQGIYRSGTPEPMQDRDHFYLASLKMDYDFGAVELISSTSYFQRREMVQGYSGTLYNLSYFQQLVGGGTDPMGIACTGGQCFAGLNPLLLATGPNLPGFGPYSSTNNIANTQANFTQEIRLQSSDPDARLTWIAGIFLSLDTQESIEEINDPQLPALTQYLWGEDMLTAWGEDLLANGDDYINDTVGHDRQIAGFFNATYAFTDQLKLQGGVRYAKTHFDFRNFSDGAQNFGPNGGTGKQDETPFTPTVGVTYQASDDDMFYATFAKGYRIGGANPPFPQAACQADLDALGITSVPSSFNSDRVTSYELGSKDKMLDGRLQLAGSVFYLTWNNIQQANYLSSCGFRYITNLGSATGRGFDFQADWLATDALEFNVSLGYTDAHYANDSLSGPAIGAPVIVHKGDTLPGSPWTLAIGGQYNLMVLAHDSFVRVDYEYASRNPRMTPQTDPITTQFDGGLVTDPATNLFSVRAGTTLSNFNVALFIDNLFDSHPRLDLNHQDEATLLYEATTLRPRTAGVTVTYRY